MKEVHAPLVSCETLWEHIDDPDWVVFDCRHGLTDPEEGPRAHAAGHIPGAFHAHIDRDLSDPVGDGVLGRHPLPGTERFTAWLRTHGVGPQTQVVAYDEGPGMWAARLWWLLRHHGHEAVAVLDGGLARWTDLDLPVRGGAEPARDAGTFEGAAGAMPVADTATVEALDGRSLVDARAGERYRGEVEPVDPKAGHIPGAVNVPFLSNVGPDSRFLSPDELRARYEDFVDPVVYCGSGVTAAHAVLAMAVAGLPTPTLYTGSWSAWCHPSAERAVAMD